MARQQVRVLTVLTVVSGLLGGAAASLLLRACPAFAQGGAAQELRARQFVLVDKSGRATAMLATDSRSDQPALVLSDKAGRPRVLLQLAPGGEAEFVLMTGRGKTGALIGMDPYDQPTLMLNDRTGKTRGVFAVWGPDPTLRLLDATEADRVVLGGAETRDSTTGATTPRSVSSMSLHDETGKVLWQAP